MIEVKRKPEGKVLARRTDGQPLTAEDRVAAKTMAIAEEPPLRARVVDRVHGDNGALRAVLICSDLLEDHLWLVIDRSFIPADDSAIYYPEELPELRTKTLDELQQIHTAKLAFPGCRIIQEGAETRTVLRMAYAGDLPYIPLRCGRRKKIIRFDPVMVEKWLGKRAKTNA